MLYIANVFPVQLLKKSIRLEISKKKKILKEEPQPSDLIECQHNQHLLITNGCLLKNKVKHLTYKTGRIYTEHIASQL